MTCNCCKHADPPQKLCPTSREKKSQKHLEPSCLIIKSDYLLLILIGDIVKEWTYNIAIRCPAYNIPFDCDISIWIKWIISF